MIEVELYDTQAGFLDRIARDRLEGKSRAEALRWVLHEHIKDRLNGADTYVGGTIRRDILRTASPEYGPSRYQLTLEPITGKAVPVRRGEIFRIEQTNGGTCVDFNAFNLHDYKEFLDCGFTRSFQSFDPRRGEFIWTNAPRGRPMFGILEIADTCELDIIGHRCNRVFEELGWGLPSHANCQDTLAEAIREYRLTPDDVHDSFNLWMATTIDEQGQRQFKWNPARPGDRIELLAMFDVLAVAVICGVGDLVGINNYTFTPVRLEVLQATADTNALVDEVERRWGSLASQVGTDDLADTPVLASRELERDPAYVAGFRAPPGREHVVVELSSADRDLVGGLIATGSMATARERRSGPRSCVGVTGTSPRSGVRSCSSATRRSER
ncbi:MAG: urea carboxylase-associated family protein [Actinomycetota bacterium]|nr:urea carboxylase-associated family protein [Actinomycetota bacterium]